MFNRLNLFKKNSTGGTSPLKGFICRLRNKLIIALLFLLVITLSGMGMYWSREPSTFSVVTAAENMAASHHQELVTGYTTTATLHRIAMILLTKPGGYISNDIAPPGVFLDNISHWESGVLILIRDTTRALRRDFGRSQSQSREDTDLAIAEPQFNFDSKSWMLPSSEKEFKRGINALESYLVRLPQEDNPAQFYARSDNLIRWLADVEARLGSLSQRLSASVGKRQLNIDLAGDSEAQQSTNTPTADEIKTPWLELDDVFYETRGYAWALLHMLQAVQYDFSGVLGKKNARVSLEQIIRELEPTQEPVWSPIILNGSGFGLLANHSLVMANYISRANAAIIDLHRLLEKG
ncbi:hypothetical protein CI610_01195 [invertebrate metagenome]|uniref:DUF2333 domain-containing protein n=1 Tax=invertebrate metagenome TaxID=1711999 RepID=A0A2H9T9G6_9ZZZZ